MNKLALVVLLSSMSALSSCASEYKRVPIPASEQEHKALPQPPELNHINWKTIRYEGRQYYALDGKNMAVLNDNLNKMAQYNDLATNNFEKYESSHPEKTTKVVRKKGFWVYANKWWFGCNDKEFQNTPSCKPFQAPDDYVPEDKKAAKAN